jgi:pseudomonalisin
MIKRLSIGAVLVSSIALNVLAATASHAFPTWNRSIMSAESYIQKGGGLTSPNKCFNFVYAKDGALRLYNNEKRELIWHSGTDHNPNAGTLKFQGDGNFVLYENNREVLWQSHSSKKGGRTLVMQNDGNLVIYTNKKHAVWATNTSDSSYANKSRCKI